MVLIKFTFLSALLIAAHASNIGYFWHITDLHYDSFFSTHGDVKKACWRVEGRGNRRPAGRFGDFSCDSPWELIESAAQAMRQKQSGNVEFVLWTGDALSHTAKRWPESQQLELLQNVTDLLKRTFSSDFVFPALGHDDPPRKKQIGELWRLWLPPDSMHTFDRGGYYMIERKLKKLQIIVLNTNLLIGREGRVDGREVHEDETKKMWEWLDTILSKCALNKQTVYLVGHHPPGVDERQRNSHSAPAYSAYSDHHNRKYLRLIRKYSDIIVGQFFGHLHSDTFRIIYNEKGRPVSWAMVAPSITPRRTNDGPNNPGIRLYKFDTDTGTILDYTQFFLDLSKSNTMQEAEWQPSYNLTSYYYGLGNVTATSLHNLAEKFTQPVIGENTYFAKYFVANSVRIYNSPLLGGCDLSCAHTHYCAITRVDYKEYKLCVETAASALASITTTINNAFYNRLNIFLIMSVVFLLLR